MIFRDCNIPNVPKNIFKTYNIFYNLKNIDNKTFIPLDILTIIKTDIVNLTGTTLNGRIKVKRKNISNNRKIKCLTFYQITKDHKYLYSNDLFPLFI